MSKTEIYDVNIDTYTSVIDNETKVISIEWDSNIGWGIYTLCKTKEGWIGDSECMDRGEDKDFLKTLLNKFAESVVVKS